MGRKDELIKELGLFTEVIIISCTNAKIYKIKIPKSPKSIIKKFCGENSGVFHKIKASNGGLDCVFANREAIESANAFKGIMYPEEIFATIKNSQLGFIGFLVVLGRDSDGDTDVNSSIDEINSLVTFMTQPDFFKLDSIKKSNPNKKRNVINLPTSEKSYIAITYADTNSSGKIIDGDFLDPGFTFNLKKNENIVDATVAFLIGDNFTIPFGYENYFTETNKNRILCAHLVNYNAFDLKRIYDKILKITS